MYMSMYIRVGSHVAWGGPAGRIGVTLSQPAIALLQVGANDVPVQLSTLSIYPPSLPRTLPRMHGAKLYLPSPPVRSPTTHLSLPHRMAHSYWQQCPDWTRWST